MNCDPKNELIWPLAHTLCKIPHNKKRKKKKKKKKEEKKAWFPQDILEQQLTRGVPFAQ
jgi:hypothetical protein